MRPARRAPRRGGRPLGSGAPLARCVRSRSSDLRGVLSLRQTNASSCALQVPLGLGASSASPPKAAAPRRAAESTESRVMSAEAAAASPQSLDESHGADQGASASLAAVRVARAPQRRCSLGQGGGGVAGMRVAALAGMHLDGRANPPFPGGAKRVGGTGIVVFFWGTFAHVFFVSTFFVCFCVQLRWTLVLSSVASLLPSTDRRLVRELPRPPLLLLRQRLLPLRPLLRQRLLPLRHRPPSG